MKRDLLLLARVPFALFFDVLRGAVAALDTALANACNDPEDES